MAAPLDPTELAVPGPTGLLSVSTVGSGPAVVLLHGLTASRRYVVMGSSSLWRSGFRQVSYDARGHGKSVGPHTPDSYRYEALASDLRAVLDALEIERAIIAGASMGAHTAIRFALDFPSRVEALCLITPAFLPGYTRDLPRWDALADGLQDGGIDGFVNAYELDTVALQWRETLATVLRQRMALHQDFAAVSAALRGLPRAELLASIEELSAISSPATVVGSRDEADPGHPLAVAEAWTASLANAELLVEERGKPPIAWQGGRVARAIIDVAERATANR